MRWKLEASSLKIPSEAFDILQTRNVVQQILDNCTKFGTAGTSGTYPAKVPIRIISLKKPNVA